MTDEAKANSAGEFAAIADVLVPVAIDHSYSYLVPSNIPIAPGDFAELPLGTRMTNGVVWETRSAAAGRSNLKSITARLDIPPLSQSSRKFIDWVAAWTLGPRGMVLRMTAAAPLHAGPEPARVGVRLTGHSPGRMTPARARVLAAAQGGLAFSKSALAETAACSSGVIDMLIDEGVLEAIALA